MMTIQMSYHAHTERADRLAACIECIGVGHVVYEVANYRRDREAVTRVTSTGLVLIMNKNTNTVITGYAATPKQIAGIYQGKAPQSLFNRVKKNYEKFRFLYEI